jgi:hypothetical protein
MPKGHNTTREVGKDPPFNAAGHAADTGRKLVKGVRLRHVLAAQGKRIPWCDYCNRAMFQFLATEKVCPRNCGKDITALAATMGCTHPGFEEAVWPKIKASLRRELQDLYRDGNIVIYIDRDGVEQAYRPVQTDRWRRSDWDGSRDHVVPEYIWERLENHGTLEEMGGGGQERGGAYYVFERGRGGRGDARPDARRNTYHAPYAETVSETTGGSSGRSRRHAPWNASAGVSRPYQPQPRASDTDLLADQQILPPLQ